MLIFLYGQPDANSPFTQGQLPPPQRVRSSSITPVVAGLALTTVVAASPFSQQVPPAPQRVRSSAPIQIVNRLPLVANLGPFSISGMATANRIRGASVTPGGLNLNLFTNPIPFLNLDASIRYRMARVAPVAPQNILPLSTVVATAPFTQYIWAGPFRVRAAQQAGQQYNPNLFTNPIPFSKTDWPLSRRLSRAASTDVSLPNPLIFSEVPFRQNEWPSVRRVYRASFTDAAPASPLIFSEVPFSQSDWPQARTARGAAPFGTSLNINIYTNPIPFAQLDWPQSAALRRLQPPAQPYNISIFSEVPLTNVDWTRAYGLRPVRQDYPQTNFNLYLAQPFAKLDWPAPAQRVATNPALYPNLNLISGVAPFTGDFTPARRVAPRPVPDLQNNLALYAPPAAPFAQLQWPAAVRIRATLAAYPVQGAILYQTFYRSPRVVLPAGPSRIVVAPGPSRALLPAGPSRVVVARNVEMELQWPNKDPGEDMDFDVDYAIRLVAPPALPGDTVLTSDWVKLSGDAVMGAEAIIGGRFTKVWISAGTNDTLSVFKNTIVTAQGRTMIATCKLWVTDDDAAEEP